MQPDNTFENRKKPRGIQLLMDIADLNTAELIAAGIDSAIARKIALSVSEKIRNTYGGEKIYFCKGTVIDVNRRHWQIWDEFTGRNHFQLAKKFNLSVRQVEKIIARCRDESR